MRSFYALFVILLIATQVKSQDRASTVPNSDAVAKTVRFYPNPATSFITFEFRDSYNKSYNFQIFNFLGKKVYEAANISAKTVIPLGDFFQGMYIFQLRDKSGRVVDTGKFQVSK